MENIKNILVVSRMTPYCRDAVKFGISLAKTYGAELQVLYLYSNRVVDMGAVNAPDLSIDPEPKVYRSMQEEAKEELDNVLKIELKHSGLFIKTMVREGDAVNEIKSVVQSEAIDLMLMQAYQEGKLEHMLFGHETDDIVRSLPCSIFLLKREPNEVRW